MKEEIISEIQVQPIKPKDGLVAFARFVLFGCLYCSSVGIFTRPEGGYRLLYPNKKVGSKDSSIFHPITKEFGDLIEKEVTKTLEEVINDGGYNFSYNSAGRF
ncbi:MAG: hypothetical protein ACOYT9_02735 [Patescibacteria group bacterium]